MRVKHAPQRHHVQLGKILSDRHAEKLDLKSKVVNNRLSGVRDDSKPGHIKVSTEPGAVHAHASWLLAGGADLQIVRERLGHAGPRATERYLHTLPDADDTALAAFNRTRTGARQAAAS